ncbi:MAG: NAD(P)H-dependent oxidoreductase [Candidatus Nanopelagicales bacterium]
MTLLRIDGSILGPNSASSELADIALAEFVAVRPDVPVVSRHLAVDPISSDAWQTAIGASYTPEEYRTPEQKEALELAATVASELRDADVAVLALPLYNWGVSQHSKTWIDLAIAGSEQGERLLDGKHVLLITTRGGSYAPGTPKEGWDHNVEYLRRILVDVWGADLTLVEREFTLVGVNPALDQFAEAAALIKKEAHEAAAGAGQKLASVHAA